jgi:hypothetical protein
MSSDALFSDVVAREVFSDAPATAERGHATCRFCGSDRAGTRERCLRVAGSGAGGHAVGRAGANFTVVCCRACYGKGVILEVTRLFVAAWVVFWVLASPVVFLAAVPAGSPTLWYAAAGAGLVAGVVAPVFLFRAFARWRMVGLLGPERDERLRREAGVTRWGVTTAVAFRPRVPAGESGTSLDGV